MIGSGPGRPSTIIPIITLGPEGKKNQGFVQVRRRDQRARMAKQVSPNERNGARQDLAHSFLDLFGFEGALRACQENGWTGVREELLKIKSADRA